MERPWLKFWTRDYLDHKELRRCSARARALWPDLLCLMNEGSPHGFLSDKIGPLDLEFIAARTVTPLSEVKEAFEELLQKHVLSVENGVYFSRKMVEDEKLRKKRADGGRSSLNNPRVPRVKNISEPEDIHDSPPKDTHQFAWKDIHNGSPLLANVVTRSRTPPIEYSLLASELKEGGAGETSADSSEKSDLVGKLRELWRSGGCQWNFRDEQAVALFESRPIAICRNIHAYASWAFTKGYWRTPDKTKRFSNLITDGDGENGAPVRTLAREDEKPVKPEPFDPYVVVR